MSEITSARPGTRPLRKDAEVNRVRIIAAAREVFAERGIEATLDDVARHAGLGVGTVYRRFPNKESLVEALFEEQIGLIVALAEAAAAAPDPWLGFVGFLEASCALQASDRGLREVILGLHGSDRVAVARDRLAPPVARIIERAQQAGMVRGDIRGPDIPMISVMIGAAVEYSTDVSPEIWRRFLAVIIDGLREQRDEPTALPVPPLTDDQFEAVMRSRSAARRPPR